MTERSSTPQVSPRELGRFIRAYFERTYYNDKQESDKKIERAEAKIKECKSLFATTKDPNQKAFLKRDEVYWHERIIEENRALYHLALTLILAQAFEGLTRGGAVDVTKSLEELTKKTEESKQEIDQQFAKRLTELFGKNGVGYIG